MPESVIDPDDREILKNPDGRSIERVIRVLCRAVLDLDRAVKRDRADLEEFNRAYPIRPGGTIDGGGE